MTDLSVESLINQLTETLAPLFSDPEQPIIVGIETGGYRIAQTLHKNINPDTELGKLNITFYRDDFTKIGLHPTVKPSSLPSNLDGKTIILVDDVLYSGRTIRAAMNELFDYGRPDKILLVILIDRGERELPIQADFVGQRITLEKDEQIKLEGPDLEDHGPFQLVINRISQSNRP